MDDLQRRFRRLDRIGTPDLWTEAVGRAAELELAPRWRFSPSLAMIAVALLTVALAGTVAVGALLNREPPAPDTATYENGWLTAQDGCGRVIGIDPKTYESRELIAVECGADWSPADPVAWSSDGRWMVHLAPAHMATQSADASSDTTAIWLYDAESGTSQPVGTCPGFFCGLDISPDGSMVAFNTGEGIAIKDLDSGAQHDFELIGVSGSPAFSPDGRRLALSVIGGQTGVHVIDVAAVVAGVDQGRTRVGGIMAAWDPTWSPDGQWIAFERESGMRDHETESAWAGRPEDATMTLWMMRPDGGGARQLTAADGAQPIHAPTWSPDSTSIAFLSQGRRPDTIALWSVRTDGGSATRIYESACCVDDYRRPAWSPDGEWIGFGVGFADADESGTVLLRPDGSDARLVSTVVSEPVWQPIPKEP
jgi:Tol biopolymer transport system component